MNNAYEQTKRILIEQAGDRVYSPGDSYASMWGKIVENEGVKLDALSRVSLMTTWKAWLNHLGGSASALESPNRVLGKILVELGGTPSVMELEGSLIRKIRGAMGNGPGPDPSFVPISATGGTVEDVEIEGIYYRVHTFTTSGDFEVTDVGSEGTVDVLLVGGGASGASTPAGGINSPRGGGGGAGDVLDEYGVPIAEGINPVVVGAGAASPESGYNAGLLGSDSSVLARVAIGGGGGGSLGTPGQNGGSGGGAGGRTNVPGGTGGVGLGVNGNDGGNRVTLIIGSAGGGGAGAPGSNNNTDPPAGGIGKSVWGSYYGGGGAGVLASAGVAGSLGGGGSSGLNDGGDGTPNTGGGGGGAGGVNNDGATARGGNGGSGIVKIRYPLEAAS